MFNPSDRCQLPPRPTTGKRKPQPRHGIVQPASFVWPGKTLVLLVDEEGQAIALDNANPRWIPSEILS